MVLHTGVCVHPGVRVGFDMALPGHGLCCTRTVFPGSRNVPNVPDVPNVPNVPNNVPNIPGHGGQDGLLAEGYVAKISMLILATYPVAALDGTIRNQNQN